MSATKQTRGEHVPTSEHGRPGTPPAAHSESDPDVLVEAEEIEDLEAPAEAQQNLAGGQGIIKPQVSQSCGGGGVKCIGLDTPI
jgi:hypothetical protein